MRFDISNPLVVGPSTPGNSCNVLVFTFFEFTESCILKRSLSNDKQCRRELYLSRSISPMLLI